MSAEAKEKKVEISFTNWVLGGSLLTITATDQDKTRNSKGVLITEVDSDNDIILVKHKYRKSSKRDKKKAGASTEATQDKKDKDHEAGGETKKTPKHMCKSHHHHCSKNQHRCQLEEDNTAPQREKLAHENKDKAKNGAAGFDKGDGGWTSQHDKKIEAMKAENKSWKEIAFEIGASKKDVTRRFRELQKDNNGKNDTKEDRKNTGGNDRNRDTESMDFSGLFGDPRDESINDQNKFGNGKHSDCKDHKSQQKTHHSNGNNQGINKVAGPPPSTTSYSSESFKEVRLRPGGIWSRDDCEILEYLEARYEDHKWLHMQASFFNWTGRMIVSDIIEKKFRDDGFI